MKAAISTLFGLLLFLAAPPEVQAQFSYTTNRSVITLSKYSGNGGAVVISNFVNSIGSNAFSQCESLTSVTIPGTVASIGDFAFNNCPLLTNATISNGVISIGSNAFEGTGLINVTIPISVTNIGVGPFADCTSLTGITVVTQNPFYSSTNGALFDESQTTLIQFPAGLGGIYSIPNTVTNIGEWAFYFCTGLTNVTMPASVTSIGQDAFAVCTNLTNVTIGTNVISIGELAFAQCSALTTVTIPNSVTSMGDFAFDECYSLTRVTISTNVTSIGEAGFAQCYSLTNVTIPARVTTIGDYAFLECYSLIAITVNTNNPAYSSEDGILFNKSQSTLIDYPEGITGGYTISNSVTDIGQEAFDSGSLASVTIPNGVTNIEDYAFAVCTNLTSVYFTGNAPTADSTVFNLDSDLTVYYLSGATGWQATFAGARTAQLTAVAITASPTNGVIPLSVNFTAAGVDSNGHAITNWTWDFGDGSISTAQNPSHIYTGTGAFIVDLIETNNNGVPIAGAVAFITAYLVEPVYSGLVLNGGFETGDFTGWVLSGGEIGDNAVDDGSFSGILPYSGSYLAVLGSSGSLSFLSQTLATTAGAPYTLALWLNSPDGETPNEFLVSWNGNTLFKEKNVPAIGWTNLQFSVSATGTSTVLEFGGRDDNSYFGLDAISVRPPQPGIASARVSGANLVLSGINGQTGGTYYVLAGTNLALPLSLWTPVATNVLSTNGNFTLTLTNTVTTDTPQRFYILQTQ